MLPQLLGLGDAALDAEVDGFLLKSPTPSSSQVAEFLQLYSAGENRDVAARALIVKGVSANAVANALTWLSASGRINWPKIWSILAVASAAASGYHGYRRNNSIGWAIIWFALGGAFPVFTPVVALAQGFGERKVR